MLAEKAVCFGLCFEGGFRSLSCLLMLTAAAEDAGGKQPEFASVVRMSLWHLGKLETESSQALE